MKRLLTRQGLLLLGSGLAAMVTLPGYSQTSGDAALEAACRNTEVTVPASCPCTITKARGVGLNDAELASLFKDDGHSQPVTAAKYSAFWQVKAQCIADATMASLGISAANPLPGVPANMRPGMPLGGAPAAPVAAPKAPSGAGEHGQTVGLRPPPPPPPSMASDLAKPGPRTISSIEAMIAKLRDTAWEYTEKDGEWHRYDFLPEGNLVVYQTRSTARRAFSFTEVSILSAQENRYGAFMRARSVTTGEFQDLPIISLTDTVLTYQKRYVRTGEEWAFRKVGPAAATLPDAAPQRLEGGFWKAGFNPISKNPLILNQNRLSGFANAANRTLKASGLVGERMYLIGDTSSDDCNSKCFLALNEIDRRSRTMKRRIIEESGVDHVGVRPEPSPEGTNIASLRVFDGYGGWKQWRCASQGLSFGCTATGSQAAPQSRPDSAKTDSASLIGRLGAVRGELMGDSLDAMQSSEDYYFMPADGRMPQGMAALSAHIRTHDQSLFATRVDFAGQYGGGLKINYNSQVIVLQRSRDLADGTEFSNGTIRVTLRRVGNPIFDRDQPAFGFHRIAAEIAVDGETEAFDAIMAGGG